MIEFAKVCRLCISDSNTLINALSLDEDSVRLCDKLRTVCDIQINSSDCLPTTICVACQEKLRQFYEFKLMCLNSNVLLNRYKKDLSASTHLVNEFRKKYNTVFGTIDIKQEKNNDTELNDGASNSKSNNFTGPVDEGSQNVIPQRKTRKSENEPFEEHNSYDAFTSSELELDVQEVEEVLIKWGENKSTTSTGNSNDEEIKSETDAKSTGATFKNIIVSEVGLTQTNSSSSCKSEDARDASSGASTADSDAGDSDSDGGDSDRKDADYKPDAADADATPARASYFCHTCNKQYTSKRGLTRHAARHTQGMEDFRCESCGKAFTTELGLRQHILRSSGERPYSCGQCGKAFSDKPNLYNHRRVHSAERPYACELCGKTFKFASCRRTHLKYHAPERPFLCSVCGKAFTLKITLQNHLRIHSGERPFKCDECGAAFADPSSLKSHHVKHTTGRPFQCETCFQGKRNYVKCIVNNCPTNTVPTDKRSKVYYLPRNEERRFKWLDLLKRNDLRTKTPSQLTGSTGYGVCGLHFEDRHFATYEKKNLNRNAEPNEVTDVDKMEDFKWEKSLKSHRKLHLRTAEQLAERRFSCEVCGKQFRTKDSLVKHGAVHSDARPWECARCGKTFKFQSCWRTHLKHHEGKRVVCTICGKKYLNNSVLNNHMRLHTGEKPFKCPLCDKAFADNSTLRSHKISHSNIKQQRCPLCGLEFKHRSYLVFHMKKKHQDEQQQQQQQS